MNKETIHPEGYALSLSPAARAAVEAAQTAGPLSSINETEGPAVLMAMALRCALLHVALLRAVGLRPEKDHPRTLLDEQFRIAQIPLATKKAARSCPSAFLHEVLGEISRALSLPPTAPHPALSEGGKKEQ